MPPRSTTSIRHRLQNFVQNTLPRSAVFAGRQRIRLKEALHGITLNDFHFDIVHGCQLRCVGCPNSTLLPKIQRVTVENFERCLANVDVAHVKRFAFFNYGEPLLHPELAAIVAVLPRQRWTTDRVEISTNAQNINWSVLEETIKQRVITHFAISCDGNGTPEDYERLRPPAKWAKLVECFQKISEIRDRHHPELQILTRTIIQTRSDRLRWEETLRPFGIIPEFRGWMNLVEASTKPNGDNSPIGRGICHWMSDRPSLYATATGEVVPCCLHPRAGVLGNLLKQKHSDIRKGELRKEFRHQLQHNRSAMEICGRCEAGPNGMASAVLAPDVLA